MKGSNGAATGGSCRSMTRGWLDGKCSNAVIHCLKYVNANKDEIKTTTAFYAICSLHRIIFLNIYGNIS